MNVPFNIEPLTATLFLGVSALILVYWLSIRNYDYWKRKGVRFIKPLPVFGSVLDNFLGSLHEIEENRYKKYGTIYGYFEGNKPILSVADPDLLRSLLVKDFFSFTGRRKVVSGNKIFDSMVSVLEAEDWKRVRSIISPTFSTGKMKRIFHIFKDCSMTLVQNFKKAMETGESVEIKSLYGTFTMDTIASSAFSVKIDSYNDPNNLFVQYAKKVFSRRFNLKFVLFFLAPKLARFLRITFFGEDVMNFFKDVTFQVLEERKKSDKIGNDFLQLLIDTTKEVVKEEKSDLHNYHDHEDITSNYGEDSSTYQVFKSEEIKHLSMDELVAQCVLFFLAGYETTAATLAFASYNLALNPDLQEKLRREVDDALTANNGELTYEAVQGMKYLDNIISETLRIYPPAVRLERVADADYKLGDTGITIPKGMIVSVPTYALHKDPKYFPDPEKFDPDRFIVAERSKRHPYVYLPFGAGPRNCVGMRFALLEIKVCLVLVAAHFVIKRGSKTKVPLEFVKRQGFLQTKETFVDLEIRKTKFVK